MKLKWLISNLDCHLFILEQLNWFKYFWREISFFWHFVDDVLAFHADDVDDMDEPVTYTATVDHDISRMENLLDQWTAELKKNVMVLFTPFWLYLHLSVL